MKKSPQGKAGSRWKRSPCPITNTLDTLGDKWTLLVVRDLFLGHKTYGEFAASPEGIPTNILAERLKRLVNAGIVTKQQYQSRPVRYAYSLTDKGRALGPVLRAMIKWANVYIPGTITVDEAKRRVAASRHGSRQPPDDD